ncbi:MAG: hypothetical protein IPK50_14645 [Fibrobacterota bacterium]|nr:hypothetical protein [Fibrobacterota bacterium]QQS03533.1 MAG: hypothetical protein IPK50_14645 [Fibrobacterota bacterium]
MERARDWLLRLLLAEAQALWEKTQRVTDTELGHPPRLMTIHQLATLELSWVEGFSIPAFRGVLIEPILRTWGMDDHGWVSGPAEGLVSGFDHGQPRKGSMFFEVASFRFAISADRTMVGVHYAMGPRYGQRLVYRVSGQGSRGSLAIHPDAVVDTF